jgi:hypothetical protein
MRSSKKSKAKSAGSKYDNGKPSLSLIDPYAMRELARVLDYGARKYASWNWRKGIQWSRVLDATLRHLNAFNDGEDIDPESGLPHLAHAMFGPMVLLRYSLEHKELDDRYKR